MTVNEPECHAAGINPKTVSSIARRMERAALEARRLGLQIFGGSGWGSIRAGVDGQERQLILARMNGNWSGGDGTEMRDENGLTRGEGA